MFSSRHNIQNISSIVKALTSQAEDLDEKIRELSDKEKDTVQKLSEKEAQADDKIAEVEKLREKMVCFPWCHDP